MQRRVCRHDTKHTIVDGVDLFATSTPEPLLFLDEGARMALHAAKLVNEILHELDLALRQVHVDLGISSLSE